MRHRAIDTGEMGCDFRPDECLGLLNDFPAEWERTVFFKRLPQEIGPPCRQ